MEFIKYPKINSLWKRNGWNYNEKDKKDRSKQKGRQDFIEGDYACPEFALIKYWHVEEKIDGTNIRIHFEKETGKVRFGGRTDNASIPAFLLDYLQDHFTTERLDAVFDSDVILFGEGYGPKIQKVGSLYSDHNGFCLFDVRIGNFWLKREDVYDVAGKLEVPHAPLLGHMGEFSILRFIKSTPQSGFSKRKMEMEGVMCRANPQLFCRSGDPVMFKLKCKDFK